MSGRHNSLPPGWAAAHLGDVAQPSRPRHDPQDYPNLPFIGMENVEAQTMKLLGTVPAATMRSSAVHFFPGDVLYGRLRPYLNKVLCPDFEGLCSAEFIVLPESEYVDSSFVQYRLNSADFVTFASHLNTGDRPRVDLEQISQFRLAIPPLPEQRRIVAEIEKQFTRLEAGIAALKRTQTNLKRYRAAVLKAAVEGRLVPTEAELARRDGRSYEPASELLKRILAERRARWEADQLAKFRASGKLPTDDKWKQKCNEGQPPDKPALPPLPEGWTWATMPQLGELNRGKSKHRPRDDARLFGGAYPFIQTGDVKRSAGYIRVHSQTYNEAGLAQSRLWPAGTLCITIAANIAESGILTYPACFPDSVVGFKMEGPPETVRFAQFFVDTAKSELARFAPATAQKNINLEILSDLAIPLPPLDEQQRIVAEVERRLSVTEELEIQVEANLKRAERLRQAILKCAFEGKLVPQDPSDEPASALLERIRAERDKSVVTPRKTAPRKEASHA